MSVSFKEFASRNMFWLGNSIWVLLFTFMIPVLCTLFARFPWVYNQKSQTNGVGGDEVGENPDDRNQLASEIFGFDSGFESLYEVENSFDSRSVSNATTSKYEFLAGNSFCGYIEQPHTTSFKVQELFLDPSFVNGVTKESVSAEVSFCGDLQEFDNHRKTEDSVDQEGKAEGLETSVIKGFEEADDQVKIENSVTDESFLDKNSAEEDDQMTIKNSVTNESSLVKDSGEVVNKVKSDDFTIQRCDYDESSLEKDCGEVDKVKTEEITIEGSGCDEPSLDKDFPQKDEGEIKSSIISICSYDEVVNLTHDEVVNLAHDELSELGEIVGLQDCIGGRSEEPLEEEEEVELISLDQAQSPKEENQLKFSFSHVTHKPSSLLTNDFWHTNGKFITDFNDEYYHYQSDDDTEKALAPETPICLDTNSVDPYQEDITDSDSDDDHDHDQDSVDLEMEEKKHNHVLDEDDEVDIDVLLEHQTYVQKMKKEMRHLRTIGLPTIFEDSESPRMDEDLKPLKINEKVGYKDRLDVVLRFYKTYLDKMKRLDILCHQTMYSVGFLQLKNPDQLAANKKLLLPSMKSLVPHNLLPNKFRRHESDPVQKLIQGLHKDLELVYVGQLCLSWEILKWQHSKAEELQLFDTTELRQYGLAAGEFQQFQVLVQRFTENEPFLQGPRVENYVKSRCANSNFLQVPPIKDDLKNTEGKAVVSIVRLTDIIEESMLAFWEFIRIDKKELAGNVGWHNPLDAELLTDIKTNLAKKDRRIKDLVKSGNCIVKKFQKHQEFQLTHELLLAQVELRLVARVIGMSRLTADQLMWCHKKLGKISILGKKVHVESCFSLFPC